jgi:hypothetical protein
MTALGLSDKESWVLLGQQMRGLRQQGAITIPDGVDPRDGAFDPRRGPIYVRLDGAEPRRKVLNLLPTRGVRRLDCHPPRASYENGAGALGPRTEVRR